MIAVIAIAHGQTLKPEVVKGVVSQTIPLELAIVSADHASLMRMREATINENRHTAQKHYSGRGWFVLLLDSDVVLTVSNAVQLAVEKLQSRPDLVAVLIDSKGGYSPHNYCSCCIIRDEVWARIDYRSDSMLCQCTKIGQAGKVEYLEGEFAYEIAR